MFPAAISITVGVSIIWFQLGSETSHDVPARGIYKFRGNLWILRVGENSFSGDGTVW